MKKIKLKHLFIGTVVLIIALIIAKKVGWIGSVDKTEVVTEKAALRKIIETVSASGKVQPEVEVKISPDVSGQIVELNVKEGDEVKKGTVLCKINPDIYLSNLEKMQAAVNSSKANLANSKARQAQVESSFTNTELIFNRTKKLFEQNAVSQADFDAAKAAYESAKADVEAAKQTVAASEFNVKNASASQKEASDNLQRTTILSPVNGKVSKLNVELGERVVGTSQMAGTEIMRIADLNEMEVNVEVNENDIVRISLGDTADIEVDAYLDKKFNGLVTEVANSANITGSSADQVTNFTVKIRILQESYKELIPADKKNYSPFRPGMSATVDIHTQTVDKVISIPIQAVTTREDTSSFGAKNKTSNDAEIASQESENNQSNSSSTTAKRQEKTKEYVFVLADEKARLTEVVTGIQDNNFIEIKSGINNGDEIIYAPYSAVSKLLKNNTPVKKVDKSELFKKKS
ncbi:MAG TPA: efflux RND transporter periplasmic adaptor subunit [Bacteroidia bacterium]|nr:efflux RND transporter periplasmic adaptor subunit [Bacteroidia bacterium]HRH09746.1 efflux RND transporter periplasmic adaptor subunit [Bacteroidia bacterium]HRH62923.1 efflux RND transporter periplasmic adaptor subunit [Bacteroidia bacterium]